MKRQFKWYFSLCCGLLCLQSTAQLPETDIWLFKIEKKDKQYVCTGGTNITSRSGYDNQPCFTPDDKQILYASVRDDKQADIYSYTIGSKKISRITNTRESEYSPSIMPDPALFSVVVVEADSAQRIHCYALNGHSCYTLSPRDSIGYHTWLNRDSILIYKLTEPHTLWSIDVRTGKESLLAEHPCRAFKTIPGTRRFVYGVKDSVSVTYMIYDPALRKSITYAQTKGAGEDFIWNCELGLIRSEGSALQQYDVASASWKTLFDFKSYGIQKITRFVFDSKNKQIALVSNK